MGVGPETATTVVVQMVNKLNSNQWMWDRVKFFDRRFMMQAMYQDWGYSEDKQSPLFGIPVDASDPFWDKEADVLVGVRSGYFLTFVMTLLRTLQAV